MVAFRVYLIFTRALAVTQWLKNPPTMQKKQETWVQSLSQEEPLEEGMALHSSILAWRILWTEEPGGLHFMGLQNVRHNRSDWACRHDLHQLKCKILEVRYYLFPADCIWYRTLLDQVLVHDWPSPVQEQDCIQNSLCVAFFPQNLHRSIRLS